MLTIKPNNQHVFQKELKDFQGNLAIPIQPGSYSILDATGVVVSEGDLERSDQEGTFQFLWNVPALNFKNPYTILWRVLTEDSNIEASSEFEIEQEAELSFSHSILALKGANSVTLSGVPERGRFSFSLVDKYETNLMTGYTSVEKEDYPHVLKFSSPLAVGSDTYLIILTHSLTGVNYMYNLSVASTRFFQILPRIRTYIDRVKYGFDLIKAYRDEQIFLSSLEGMSKINQTGNTTEYNWETYPKESTYEGLLVLATSLYSLRSQYLLENELAFDLQGINLSISDDKRSGLGTEIDRLEGELRDQTEQVKLISWTRSSPGVLIHRNPNNRSYSNRVRRLR